MMYVAAWFNEVHKQDSNRTVYDSLHNSMTFYNDDLHLIHSSQISTADTDLGYKISVSSKPSWSTTLAVCYVIHYITLHYIVNL